MAGATYPEGAGGSIETSDFDESREKAERRRALEDPGATWKEWLYFTAFKWWLAVVFLILDSWIITIFLIPHDWLALVGATAAAVYSEYLLYGYLWRRPDPDRPGALQRGRWPPWGEIGRWTPEGFRQRTGQPVDLAADPAPDPREFL